MGDVAEGSALAQMAGRPAPTASGTTLGQSRQPSFFSLDAGERHGPRDSNN